MTQWITSQPSLRLRYICQVLLFKYANMLLLTRAHCSDVPSKNTNGGWRSIHHILCYTRWRHVVVLSFRAEHYHTRKP